MRLEETQTFIDLQLQLESVGLATQERVLVCCQLAKELEASGDYEGAADILDRRWRGVGERPDLSGLEERVAAELLLCAGTLTGRFGKEKGAEGAQEAAIDLIGDSISIFERLGEREKIGEGWSAVGLCYWHIGAYDEARSTLSTALEVLGEAPGETKAIAVIRAALVENSAGKPLVAYKLLRESDEWITTLSSHQVNGLYHVAVGNIFLFLSANEQLATSILGEIDEQSFTDRALVAYAAAGFHFEEAGHSRFAARVLNNTGYILFMHGRLEEAHEYLDRARQIFQSLNAESSIAEVDETRARVLLAQERVVEAEQVARSAVEALSKGDDAAQLAQAMVTHGQALARLFCYEQAKATFEHASEIAANCGDRENAGQACLALIEELADVLPAYEVWARYEAADDYLAETQRPETLSRLRACARRALAVGRRALRTDLEDGWTGCDLLAEVHRYEHDLIAQAMAAEGGSISHAARRLQTKHQTLRQIINGRHKDTLGKEYPSRRRGQNETTR